MEVLCFFKKSRFPSLIFAIAFDKLIKAPWQRLQEKQAEIKPSDFKEEIRNFLTGIHPLLENHIAFSEKSLKEKE